MLQLLLNVVLTEAFRAFRTTANCRQIRALKSFLVLISARCCYLGLACSLGSWHLQGAPLLRLPHFGLQCRYCDNIRRFDLYLCLRLLALRLLYFENRPRTEPARLVSVVRVTCDDIGTVREVTRAVPLNVTTNHLA